jgi:hypothetical protein
VTRPDRNTHLLIEELDPGSEHTSIIVLGERPDEWQLALERVKREEREREEREWSQALRRARRGSEVPPNAGVREAWDEEEEWAFRIAFARAEQEVGELETLADEFVLDDDATIECAPCPELLTHSDPDAATREIVIPPALLESML